MSHNTSDDPRSPNPDLTGFPRSHSTPVTKDQSEYPFYVLSSAQRKFWKKINSFSFEDTSPSVSAEDTSSGTECGTSRTAENKLILPELDECKPVIPKPIEEKWIAQGTTEDRRPIVEKVDVETQTRETTTELMSLRSGRKYRDTLDALPSIQEEEEQQNQSSDSSEQPEDITSEEQQQQQNQTSGSSEQPDDLTSGERSTENSIVDMEPPVDIIKINQLIFNSVPILTGEIGPNLVAEINIFINCCKYVINCLAETEIQVFLKLLPTRFRGRAASALEGTGFNNFQQLETQIQNKLVNTKSYVALVNELRVLFQLPAETLTNYAQRIKTLHKSCVSKIPDRHSGAAAEAVKRDLEETAIYVFKTGIINPNHRMFLLQDSGESLASVIEKAERLEEAERQTLSILQNPLGIPLAQPLTDSYPVNTTWMPRERLGNIRDPPTHNPPQNRHHNFAPSARNQYDNAKSYQPRIKCTYCNKNNHTFSECYLRKNATSGNSYQNPAYTSRNSNRDSNAQNRQINLVQNGRSSQSGAKNTVFSQGSMKCDFCQRRGHTINHCRAKQDWVSRSAQNNQQFSEN